MTYASSEGKRSNNSQSQALMKGKSSVKAGGVRRVEQRTLEILPL